MERKPMSYVALLAKRLIDCGKTVLMADIFVSLLDSFTDYFDNIKQRII